MYLFILVTRFSDNLSCILILFLDLSPSHSSILESSRPIVERWKRSQEAKNPSRLIHQVFFTSGFENDIVCYFFLDKSDSSSSEDREQDEVPAVDSRSNAEHLKSNLVDVTETPAEMTADEIAKASDGVNKAEAEKNENFDARFYKNQVTFLAW